MAPFPVAMVLRLIAAALAASCALAIPAACAQQAPVEWKGYAGAGVIAFPKYTGGRSTEAFIAPVLTFEYKETFYLDLVRAGVRLWSSEDRKLALGVAAEPRFGFRAADGQRLGGMATRRDSLELGPSVEWEAPLASLNLAWFGDASGNSRGSSLRASMYRQLVDSAQWDIGVYAGLDRASAKVVNYYFGVRGDEVTAGRAFYQPGAATHASAGLSAAWKFGNRHALMFGLQGTRLGGAAGNSPIAETRNAGIGYVGLGWRL